MLELRRADEAQVGLVHVVREAQRVPDNVCARESKPKVSIKAGSV